MEFITNSNQYKPGLKYFTTIKVSHHDGSPVTDATNQVTVEYENITKKYTLDSNGMVNLALNLTEKKRPKQDHEEYYHYYDPSVQITAKYLDVERSSYVSKASSLPDAQNGVKPYIQARVLTEK